MYNVSVCARVGPSWPFKGSVLLAVVSFAVLAAAAPAHATKAAQAAQTQTGQQAPLTLEQAVAQVQKRTSGKVLGADTQHRGHTIEYRIKVLTPDGHVRVVPVRTRADMATKNKENH